MGSLEWGKPPTKDLIVIYLFMTYIFLYRQSSGETNSCVCVSVLCLKLRRHFALSPSPHLPIKSLFYFHFCQIFAIPPFPDLLAKPTGSGKFIIPGKWECFGSAIFSSGFPFMLKKKWGRVTCITLRKNTWEGQR